MEALSAACRVPTAEHLKKPPMRRWKSSLSQKLPPSRLNRTGSDRLMLSTDYSSELMKLLPNCHFAVARLCFPP